MTERQPGRDATDTDSRSDAQLIEATREGDSTAYETLFRRHRVAALKLAARYTRQKADQDDVVAQVFADIFQAIRNGHGPREGAFRTYMLACVRRLGGARAAGGPARLEPLDDAALQLPDTYHLSPAQRAEGAMVLDAFSALPERYRVVLWHALVEEQPAEVIGRHIGQNANAVYATLHRAREGFRLEYLAQHLSAAEPSCGITRSQLAGLVRGKLTGRAADKVHAHVDTCPECQGRLAELHSVDQAMQAIVAPAVLGVPLALYRGGWRAAASWAQSHAGWLAGAAAGVVALAVTVALLLSQVPDAGPPLAAVPSTSAAGGSSGAGVTASAGDRSGGTDVPSATGSLDPSVSPTGTASPSSGPTAGADVTPVSQAVSGANSISQPQLPTFNPGDSGVLIIETALEQVGVMQVTLPEHVAVDESRLPPECARGSGAAGAAAGTDASAGRDSLSCSMPAAAMSYSVPITISAQAPRGSDLADGTAQLVAGDGTVVAGPIQVRVSIPQDPC